MRIGYNTTGGPAIPHGDALSLFPAEDLEAPVVQDRDAVRQLEQLEDDAVLVVTPDGMASGYMLGDHPLTLIELAQLPQSQRDALAAAADISLDEFTHVRIGRTVRSGPNHSLSEFEA